MLLTQRVKRKVKRLLGYQKPREWKKTVALHRLDRTCPDEPSAELLSRVEALDPWFYPLRFGGVEVTPGIGSNQPVQRLNDRTLFRTHLLVEEVVLRYNLTGKSVLELACNMGYWSSQYVRHGATRVVGVEGRELFLDQARLYWSTTQILPPDRYQFIQGNVIDDPVWSEIRRLGPFDVVLCTGILYHLPEYRELLRWIGEVTRDLLVVDTRVSRQAEKIVSEPGDLYFNGIAQTRDVVTPNRESLLACMESVGFMNEVLRPRFRVPASLPECDDYDQGNRITIVARKT